MEQENNQKEKKRVIPFFWWFGGALLAGGLVTFTLLYGNRNKDLKALEQKLIETETTLTGENERLAGELSVARSDFDTLFRSYEAVNADLAAAQSVNSRLAARNRNNTDTITKFREENTLLQESLNTAQAENDRNSKMILTLNDQLNELQAQLSESQNQGNEQAALIRDQEAKMAADSAAMAQDAAEEAWEDVAGYINITHLNGAYGLSYRDMDNSKYFYGASMMHGYVINRRWIAGLGTAVNIYDTDVVVPLYFGLRYNLKETGFIPYISADGGIELQFDDIKEPYLFINPGLGFYKSISNKLALDFGSTLYIHRDNIKSSFINFRLGLAFKPKKMLQ